MNISKRKNVWWWVISAAIGGTTVFVLLCAEHGTPRGRETMLWAWPAVSVALSIIGARRLDRLYKLEPYTGPGLWHLELLDLVAVGIFAGVNLAVWQAAWEEAWLPIGLVATPFACGGFVGGLFAAARRSLPPRGWRWCYAFLFLLWLYGVLSIGGVVALMIVATLWGESPVRMVEEILRTPQTSIACLRVGMVCFIPGYMGCVATVSHLRRKHSTAPPSPLKDQP